MKPNALTSILAATGLALALGATSSQAALQWSFSNDGCGGACPVDAYGNSRTYSSTGTGAGVSDVGVKVTAWSTAQTNPDAYLAFHGTDSGLGVINRKEGGDPLDTNVGSPNHAMDNLGSYDFMLFEFDAEVVLSDLTLGWDGSDDDISVLALKNGFTVPNNPWDLTGAWEIIGSYQVGLDKEEAINTGKKSSSTFLIGTYSPHIGECKTGGCGTGTDAVKLLTLVGDTTPPGSSTSVPEPSTLALLAFGMLAPAALRRRRSAKSNAA